MVFGTQKVIDVAKGLANNLDLNGNTITDSTQDTVDAEKNIRVTGSSELSYGRNNGTLGKESQAIGINAQGATNFTTATGRNAARNNTGSTTTATGRTAARNNTGSNTTATGADAARNNTGSSITATGRNAAQSNTGNRTTATGVSAARNNTGSSITATGRNAAQSNTGSTTTATGRSAARSNTGNRTTATGRNAAQNNTGDRTTATGVGAARGDGLTDPTTMGDDNIGIGVNAIRNNQASGLIALGQEAGINAQQDDQLIITDRNGNRRMVMDLANGDLKIDGSLTQNATL